MFLYLQGWGKGIVLVNGFNLGRYWSAGPQQTLYLPGPILKQGKNQVTILLDSVLHSYSTPKAEDYSFALSIHSFIYFSIH